MIEIIDFHTNVTRFAKRGLKVTHENSVLTCLSV